VGEWGFSDSDIKEIDEGKLCVIMGIKLEKNKDEKSDRS
jgi:hypothetical protein